MPMFDYRCSTKPHVTFERLVKSAEDAVKCPCGDRDCRPERLLGAPGFVLSGSGYYDRGRGAAGKPA